MLLKSKDNHLYGDLEAFNHLEQLKLNVTSTQDLYTYVENVKEFLYNNGLALNLSYPDNFQEHSKHTKYNNTSLGFLGHLSGSITPLDPNDKNFKSEIYGSNLCFNTWCNKDLNKRFKAYKSIVLFNGDTDTGGGGSNFRYGRTCFIDISTFPVLKEKYKHQELEAIAACTIKNFKENFISTFKSIKKQFENKYLELLKKEEHKLRAKHKDLNSLEKELLSTLDKVKKARTSLDNYCNNKALEQSLKYRGIDGLCGLDYTDEMHNPALYNSIKDSLQELQRLENFKAPQKLVTTPEVQELIEKLNSINKDYTRFTKENALYLI